MIRVVAGAILRDGRIFACRRGPAMRLAGEWELPGGKVEPGEDDATALRRELREELGVDVRVGDYLGESCTDRIRLVAWWCETDGEPVLTEHDAAVWARATDLDTLAWAAADIPLIAAARARLEP